MDGKTTQVLRLCPVKAAKSDLNVSPKIILYAKMAQNVLKVTVQAGIQLDLALIALLHASRYVVVLVIAQTLPVKPKP